MILYGVITGTKQGYLLIKCNNGLMLDFIIKAKEKAFKQRFKKGDKVKIKVFQDKYDVYTVTYMEVVE